MSAMPLFHNRARKYARNCHQTAHCAAIENWLALAFDSGAGRRVERTVLRAGKLLFLSQECSSQDIVGDKVPRWSPSAVNTRSIGFSATQGCNSETLFAKGPRRGGRDRAGQRR